MRRFIPWIVNIIVFILVGSWVNQRVTEAVGTLQGDDRQMKILGFPAALMGNAEMRNQALLYLLGIIVVCVIVGQLLSVPSTWSFLILTIPLALIFGLFGGSLWDQLDRTPPSEQRMNEMLNDSP